jgi:hypothetical protein
MTVAIARGRFLESFIRGVALGDAVKVSERKRGFVDKILVQVRLETISSIFS